MAPASDLLLSCVDRTAGPEAGPGAAPQAPLPQPHPAGALQAPTAPLVAQPSDSLSQQVQSSQGTSHMLNPDQYSALCLQHHLEACPG